MHIGIVFNLLSILNYRFIKVPVKSFETCLKPTRFKMLPTSQVCPIASVNSSDLSGTGSSVAKNLLAKILLPELNLKMKLKKNFQFTYLHSISLFTSIQKPIEWSPSMNDRGRDPVGGNPSEERILP